jgi:hypothetical protein
LGAVVLTLLVFTAGCTQTGSMTIDTQPAGAAVAIGGIDNGTAPVTMDSWPAGTYQVTATAGGYIDLARDVTLRAGQNDPLVLVMDPVPVPAGRAESAVTVMNTGERIVQLYYGDRSLARMGSQVSRIEVTIGRDAGMAAEPFRLDGATVVLSDASDITMVSQDVPLYAEGTDPSPGTWRIVRKINSEDDNALDGNEQFVIVIVPGPGKALSGAGIVNVEIRPPIGAAAVITLS